jgi:uncharacterized protein (DUF427 family)
MKAIWNNVVLANSENTVVIEGNHYFPIESLNKEYLKKADTHSICHWKGTASYYDVIANEEINKNAAWYYPDPSGLAKAVKDRVAFWNGVEVVK